MRSSYAKGDVWDYRHNFTLQTVQKLLELHLVFRHTHIETMDSVFHFLTSCIQAYAQHILYAESLLVF